MKRIYLFILVLVSLSAGAQLPGYFTPIASPYDYQWLRARYLRLPLTTTAQETGAIRYNAADSTAEVYTGYNWVRLGGSGGGASYFAGYGLNLTGSTFRADTSLLATRLWHKKGIDSLAGVFTAGYYSKTAADGRYSQLGHTHTASHVTDFVSAARASFSAGTGINITAGVISFTGGGSGTYTFSAPLSEASGTVSITQANASTNGYLSAIDWNTFNNKQAALVSGTSIKTINGESLLGSGNITVAASGTDSASFHSLSPLPDSSGVVFERPNGTKDTLLFDSGEAASYATQQALDDSVAVLRDSIAALRADIGSGTVTHPAQSKAISIESPTASENITLFFTTQAITITNITSAFRGTSLSVSWGVYHDPSRTAGSPQAVYTTTSSAASAGSATATTFTDATIPANSWVWLTTTASTGTTTELHLTITYTVD